MRANTRSSRLVEMVSGRDQSVVVAPGLARLALMVFEPPPAGQVVLEVLVGVAILDLDLDPVDAAGGPSGAVDGELVAGGLPRDPRSGW